MATKQQIPAETFGDPRPAGTNVPDALLKIEGLRHQPGVGEFVFSLEGVKHRQIDWKAMADILGFENMPDQLVDDLHGVIWKYDLVQILVDRIKNV